jgi:hypothetical protein
MEKNQIHTTGSSNCKKSGKSRFFFTFRPNSHATVVKFLSFMKKLLTLLLFFGLNLGCFGQSKDFILLKRGANQKTQIRFYPGEEITYKSKKLGYFVTDQIVNIDKDFIYLTENILKPEEILEIDIYAKDTRNRTLRNLTALLLGAGAILISVETLNNLINTGEIQVNGGVAITSGILVGAGLALVPLRHKTFKQEKRNRVQLILKPID